MSGVVNSLTVDSLTPGTEYVFLVSAANQFGVGPWSEEVNGETSSIEARIEGRTRKCSILSRTLRKHRQTVQAGISLLAKSSYSPSLQNIFFPNQFRSTRFFVTGQIKGHNT